MAGWRRRYVVPYRCFRAWLRGSAGQKELYFRMTFPSYKKNCSLLQREH